MGIKVYFSPHFLLPKFFADNKMGNNAGVRKACRRKKQGSSKEVFGGDGMKETKYSRLYARFLGGFSLFCDGEEIQLSKNVRTKSMQLLMLLIRAGSRGLSRDRLIADLETGVEGRENQMNNLRHQVYELRRMLGKVSQLPEERYIILSDGSYYFSESGEIACDTDQIDSCWKRIRDGTEGEERTQLLIQICQSYEGEFMPELLGEEWATVENAGYRTIYFQCMQELCQILKEQGQYGQLLKLCAAASRIYPYDAWQEVQIECLLALGRRQEALRLYERTAAAFYKELGFSPFEKKRELRQLGRGRRRAAAEILDEAKRKMGEEGKKAGAYRCSYPSFQDCFRLLLRLGERAEMPAVLLLCTLMDSESTADELQLFEQVIKFSIRNGDIYTVYNPCQILVLLLQADPASGREVAGRICRTWENVKGDIRTRMEITWENAGNPAQRRRNDEEECHVPGADFQSAKCHVAGICDLDGKE